MPSESTTVNSFRLSRRSRTRSSTAKASVPARWSCSPSPTRARMASDDTIWAGSKCSDAHADLPEPEGPTRTTRHGAGSRRVTRAHSLLDAALGEPGLQPAHAGEPAVVVVGLAPEVLLHRGVGEYEEAL